MVIDLGASMLGFDTGRAYAPNVRYKDGTFRVFYSGFNGANVRLLYADSSDGKTWSNFSLALNISTIGAGVDNTHAFNAAATGDRLWYTAVSSSLYRIATCEGASGSSPNPSNCQLSVDTANQGTYDTASVTGASVMAENYVGRMWYAGDVGTNNRILYAESY